MFFKLLFLFTVVPVIELYLLIKIGSEIGVLETIMIVVLTGIIGAWLAKREGFQILMDINNSMSRGRTPAMEMVEGVLIFAGGAMLLTPGFLTDTLGFMVLIPQIRVFFAKQLIKYFKGKLKNGSFHYSVYTQGEQDSPRKNEDEKILDADDYKDLQ